MAIEFPVAGHPPGDGAMARAGGVTAPRIHGGRAHRMFLTEQLALLLETGASLHEALQTLRAQSRSPVVRSICQDLAESIENGESFAAALARHPRLFDATYVNIIRASEAGGFIQEALGDLRAMDVRVDAMQRNLRGAITYPAFLLVFSLGVVVFVLAVVFPKFATMFARIGDGLPWTTQVLLAISNALVDWWYLVAGGLGASIWLVVRWVGSAAGRARLDHWSLTIPGVRTLSAEIHTVTLMRVLGTSLGRGVPLMEALHAASEAIRSVGYRSFIGEVIAAAEAGGGISGSFRDSALVPDLVKEIIATGERTGRLAQVCTRLAGHYDVHLAERVAMVTRLAEPVMLVVMGSLVGLIVASLILPIFKLSSAA